MMYILVAWNFIVFCIYAADKIAAIRGKWRTSEAALIILAFCFGGAGALLGMSFFRHKTQKPKFKVLVPIALIINILLTLQIKKLGL